MSLRSQVIAGLRWVAGVKLVTQLFSWCVTIVVLRILTPADYGLLAMAVVAVDFLGMMGQFGAGTAIIQAPDLDERKLRQMFGFVIVVNLTLYGILFLAAPVVAAFFETDRLTAVVRTIGLQLIVDIFCAVPGAQLSRNMRYKSQSMIDLTATVVSSLAVLALAWAGLGVWALAFGHLAGGVWRAIGLNIAWPYFGLPRFSLAGARQLVIFGGNVTITRILWFFYSRADAMVVGKLLGETLLGVYSVALQLAQFPASKLSAIVNEVSFPAFASMQDQRERYAASFLAAVRAISFAIFPVLWGMSSIAPEAVTVLLGEKWLAAIAPLQLLALILPIHVFAPFMNTAATAIGRADIPVKQVLLAVLIMPAAFVFGSRWGVVGIAIAWLAAFPFVFVGGMQLFLPVIGLRKRDMLRAMARPVLASAGMYAVVTAAREGLGSMTSGVGHMAVLVLAGAAAYLVLTLLINRRGYREMMGALRG